MKKLFLFLMIGHCLVLCGQEKAKSEPPKKVKILPVYLVYSARPLINDSAFDKIVQLAFTRHKVEMINEDKFKRLIENEVSRVETKFRARGNQFNSESELNDAISNEQQFVSNYLLIDFRTEMVNDTLTAVSATWEAIPSPVNVKSARSSGQKEIILADLCCSVQDNIFAIVDKILFSKWLR